jgi:hypothetical protein
LTLAYTDYQGELFGYWEYNTELFNSDSVVRWSEDLMSLMQDMVRKPEQTISNLALCAVEQDIQKPVRRAMPVRRRRRSDRETG